MIFLGDNIVEINTTDNDWPGAFGEHMPAKVFLVHRSTGSFKPVGCPGGGRWRGGGVE